MSDLISLVVQSKKALQQAEATCSSTNLVARRSGNVIVDLLATDAKVKWLSDGVVEQLNAAVTAAQAIQDQRGEIQARAVQWDAERRQLAHYLDSVLESLAKQSVPPSLHEVASASSLFGSQHGSPPPPSNDGRSHAAGDTGFLRTVEEIRKLQGSQDMKDRSKWRSLRDFVDERGIDEAADAMDTERAALDALLATTSSYPDSILKLISNIQAQLPLPFTGKTPSMLQAPLSLSPSSPPPTPAAARRPPMSTQPTTSIQTASPFSLSQAVTETIEKQDALMTAMAHHLESLAGHYDQMTQALRDHGSDHPEAESSPTYIVGSAETYKPGPVFSFSPPKEAPLHAKGVDVPARSHNTRKLAEEDLQVFIRDTEELPSVLADIEDAASQVIDLHDQLQGMQDTLHASLQKFESIVDLLDALADDMEQKLREQQRVDLESFARHETLDSHLGMFDQLSQTYIQYNQAYQKLLLEMDRRRRNRDAMEELVHDMIEKLEQMRDDETVAREQFIIEQGQFLPDDLCPFVADQPVRWAVEAVGDETLPDVQESILVDARRQIVEASEQAADGV